MVLARPGQARPGRGRVRPRQSRSVQTTRQTLTLCPSVGISLLRVAHTHTHRHTDTHTYTYVDMCSRASQSLIMLMDIRFDLVEPTRAWASLPFSFLFSLLFSSSVPGKAVLTSCHLMSYIQTHTRMYVLCVVTRTSF